MKKLLFFSFSVSFILINTSQAQLVDRFRSRVKQRVDNKVDNAMDKTLDETEKSIKGKKENKKEEDKNKATSTGYTKEKEVTAQTDRPAKLLKDTQPPEVQPASLKVYQNYDFVPGDKILFEDNFIDDQDGEFPSHWELDKGQAILNKMEAVPAFYLTEGNYARVRPRMKTAKYLTEPFTVEFDYYHIPGAYGIITQMQFLNPECDCESSAEAFVNETEAAYSGGAVSLSKSFTDEMKENFDNKWHHVAMVVRNHQLKLYVDQSRVLVVPDTKAEFYSLAFAGIGDEKLPIIFKNIRIASGGNMNMLGKKFTESKIVTHGINFDIDKATIRPESMGTLNMIVQVMKDNPDLKFEIDGHTDNSGTAAHNLTLSQQRADAVKVQLVSMGIDASRLKTKGLGNTKPISDNTTIEGKANNRRVEFVKI